MVLFFTLTASDAALETYERLEASKILLQSLWILVGALIWAGSWTILNRMVSSSSQFAAHLSAAAAAGSVLFLAAPVLGTVAFALALERSAEILALTFGGALLTWLLFRHLQLCSMRSRRVLAGVAGGIALGIVGLLYLSSVVIRSEFIDTPEFPSDLRPGLLRIAPAKDLESFLRDAEDLRREVDELAREADPPPSG